MPDIALNSLRLANLTVSVEGSGINPVSCLLNGNPSEPCLPADWNGDAEIVITLA